MPSSQSSIVEALGFGGVGTIDALLKFFQAAVASEEMLRRVEGTYPEASNDLGLVRNLSAGDVDALSGFLPRYASLRKPLIGYLFSRGAVDALDHEFRVKFGFVSTDAPNTRRSEQRTVVHFDSVFLCSTHERIGHVYLYHHAGRGRECRIVEFERGSAKLLRCPRSDRGLSSLVIENGSI
jgi:hypothetical protein